MSPCPRCGEPDGFHTDECGRFFPPPNWSLISWDQIRVVSHKEHLKMPPDAPRHKVRMIWGGDGALHVTEFYAVHAWTLGLPTPDYVTPPAGPGIVTMPVSGEFV